MAGSLLNQRTDGTGLMRTALGSTAALAMSSTSLTFVTVAVHIVNMTSDKITEISAAQARAARALLGLSQQELAKRAKVATSTVADFERGYRNPVANNLQAMREALTAEGISFLPGGAIVGPPAPLTPRSGVAAAILQPFRLIDESDLSRWADRRDGQDMMPELIRRLILGEHGYHDGFRFPSGDSVRLPGWDGISNVGVASNMVPAGPTGWEFGTDKKVKSKADDDFAKRTSAPLELDPAKSTFVFVTPRPWSGKAAWLQDAKALGKWADVRAYDGVDLVQWIEKLPAVALWLARMIGKLAPTGFYFLQEAWDEWSQATQRLLSENLVLLDRDEQATVILNWSRGEPAILTVEGESTGEVVAFLHAAIAQLPADISEVYHARAVVADTPDVARSIANSPTPLIVICEQADAGLAAQLVKQGHYVYIPRVQAPGLDDSAVSLSRPTRYAIQNELIAMGFSEDEADRWAKDCARSLTVLRRLIPSAPGREVPEWAKPEYGPVIAPALLAGGWDEGNDADREIVSRLTGKPYEEVARHLVGWLHRADSPVRKVGQVWKVASPRDAWFRVASYLTSDDMVRFVAVVLDVLRTSDPRFHIAPDERWMASVRGVRPTFSGILVNGISETVALLGVFPGRASGDAQSNWRSEHIVRELLSDADSVRWWSVGSHLKTLAEASPDAFLKAAEDSLARDDAPIMGLFGGDVGHWGGAHHSHLLWALEMLAWSTTYLTKTCDILASLTERDPGGTYSNRPAHSLRNIFLLWHPQTNATWDERSKVLNRLRKRNPDVAWRLMLSLLPKSHDHMSPSPKAQWRDFGRQDGEIEPASRRLIGEASAEIGHWLIADAGQSPRRWKELIETFDHHGAAIRDELIAALRELAQQLIAPEDAHIVSEALRHFVYRHRKFQSAQWALKSAEIDKLAEIQELFRPRNGFFPVVWLFESDMAELPIAKEDSDYNEIRRASGKARVDAVRELVKTHGVGAVRQLAELVRLPGLVGQAAADALPEEEVSNILVDGLKSDSGADRNLAQSLTYAMQRKLGSNWTDRMIARLTNEGLQAQQLANFFASLPTDSAHFSRVAAAGESVELAYWKQVRTTWVDESVDTIIFALDKLLEVERGYAAVELAGQQHAEIPADVLIRVLDGAVNANDRDDDPGMFGYYVEQVFKALDKAGTSDEEFGRLEWIYLQVLDDSQERAPKALYRSLATIPDFFAEIVVALYKRDDGAQEEPSSDEKRSATVATQAFHLLQAWKTPPGLVDGKIDPITLRTWVEAARESCRKHGRLKSGERHIGQVLAFSPLGEDGLWPAEGVRDIIDEFGSVDIGRGFFLGVVNSRGVTSRMPTDGGLQERDLAAQYRTWAKSIELEWPRTAGELLDIARSYDHDAKRHDDDAEAGQW